MASPVAIGHAAKMLVNGKKTGLVLGNLALRGDPLEIAGRIAAKTNAALLSETFPSFSLARGEGRPIVEIIPYFLEAGFEFLKDFEQLIFFQPRLDGDIEETARGEFVHSTFRNRIGNKDFRFVHDARKKSGDSRRRPAKRK